MVSRDFQALAARREARARLLAGRYPASRDALQFFAEIAAWQQTVAVSLQVPDSAPDLASRTSVSLEALLPLRTSLVKLVIAQGPEILGEEALLFDPTACLDAMRAYLARQDTTSRRSFFARVLLQPVMFVTLHDGQDSAGRRESLNLNPFGIGNQESAANCPHCGHAPQAGCLRQQGDGLALSLICSLCLSEWPFPRLRCPACGQSESKRFAFYNAPEFPYLELQVCESCDGYLTLVNISKEPEAIPDVDDIAALPLDVWAQQQGFHKMQPNLAGI